MGVWAQIGLAKRIVYSGTLPRPPQPAASLDPTSAAYRAQADLVLAYSANLTDVYKLQVQKPNIPYLLAQPAHAPVLLACSCHGRGATQVGDATTSCYPGRHSPHNLLCPPLA